MHCYNGDSRTCVCYLFCVYIDTATVADLVGLTFWKYLETTKDPVPLVCKLSSTCTSDCVQHVHSLVPTLYSTF